MNIKSLSSPIINLDPTNRTLNNKDVRTESSSDRDANGQRDSGEHHEEKRHLNEDEIKKALEYLKNIPGVKNHNLQVRVQYTEDTCFFILETVTGERIRRLSTTDVWRLLKDQDQSKGNLLNKAM